VLVEVIIAISLFGLLLAALFGIFSNYIKTDQALTKARTRYERLLLAQTKLQRIFAHTVFTNPEYHHFYLNDANELIFTYDNCFETATQFPAIVLAKLFVDEENKLNLAIWLHDEEPIEKSPEKFRKDFILDNISKVEFEFFKAPLSQKERAKKTKTEESPDVPQGHFVGTWPKKLKSSPTLLKMTLSPDDTTFWFVLPSDVKPAIYEKR
jgi:type II secretory pathway pseudopilin PulG